MAKEEQTEDQSSPDPKVQENLIKALKGEIELKEALEVDDLFVESVEQKAYALYADGRYYTAETLLKGLTSLDSQRPYPFVLLGDIALRTDRADEAAEHLQHACEIDGSDPVASLKLGEALLRGGRSDEGIAALQQAVANAGDDKDNPHVKRAQALLSQHQTDANAGAVEA
jgi:predicted Zn-dependent protease